MFLNTFETKTNVKTSPSLPLFLSKHAFVVEGDRGLEPGRIGGRRGMRGGKRDSQSGGNLASVAWRSSQLVKGGEKRARELREVRNI